MPSSSPLIPPGQLPPDFLTTLTQPFLGKAPNTQSMVCLCETNRFQRFHNASRSKFWASSATNGCPQKQPKWKPIPAWKASGAIEKLMDVRKIAVDAKILARDLPATPCTIVQGNRRLMSPQNASLMVVGHAARLHTCGSSDLDHLCDLIFIIGLGLPVVLAATWKVAGGHPSRLAALGCGFFLHASAAKKKPCTFMLGRFLRNAHPEVKFALQHCAEQTKSKWTVVADKGQPLAANGVRVDSTSQLAAAILKLRTLEADGSRGYSLGPSA